MSPKQCELETMQEARITGPSARQLHISDYCTLLEREAGHVVVSLLLIALGAGLWMLKVPKGEDVIPFALGVLGRSMIGKQNNQP